MIMDLRGKLIIFFCLLVIQSENTCAFFDSIKATIDEAKVYLNDILPMINGGLKAVKQFEEFVENTLDEECFFECPRGKVLNGSMLRESSVSAAILTMSAMTPVERTRTYVT